ncbi:hypothetical protein D3C73_1073730 [compost metagenome]
MVRLHLIDLCAGHSFGCMLQQHRTSVIRSSHMMRQIAAHRQQAVNLRRRDSVILPDIVRQVRKHRIQQRVCGVIAKGGLCFFGCSKIKPDDLVPLRTVQVILQPFVHMVGNIDENFLRFRRSQIRQQHASDVQMQCLAVFAIKHLVEGLLNPVMGEPERYRHLLCRIAVALVEITGE